MHEELNLQTVNDLSNSLLIELDNENNPALPLLIYFWQSAQSSVEGLERTLKLEVKKKLLIKFNKDVPKDECLLNKNFEKFIEEKLKDESENDAGCVRGLPAADGEESREDRPEDGVKREEAEVLQVEEVVVGEGDRTAGLGDGEVVVEMVTDDEDATADTRERSVDDGDGGGGGGILTTMLESASPRLPAGGGLPSFACSVQPNRSLPLRPAPPIPRRKPSVVLCATSSAAAAASPHQMSAQGSAEDGQRDRSPEEDKGKGEEKENELEEEEEEEEGEEEGGQSEESASRRPVPADHQAEPPSQPHHRPDSAAEAPEAPPFDEPAAEAADGGGCATGERPAAEALGAEAAHCGPRHQQQQQQHQTAKAVPPLRLKKIASRRDSAAEAQPPPAAQPALAPTPAPAACPNKQQPQQRRRPSREHEEIVAAEDVEEEEEEEEGRAADHVDGEADADGNSRYCVVTTPTKATEEAPMNGPAAAAVMGLEKQQLGGGGGAAACAADSIEIVIPSLPELGIKETRTDRISLSNNHVPSKPLMVNYVMGKDGQYPAMVPVGVHLSSLSPVPAKTPDPGGHKLDPQPNQSQEIVLEGEVPVLSMPHISNDDVAEVQIIEPAPAPQPVPAAPPATEPTGSSAASPSIEKRREWFTRRQQMRDKFRDQRSRAINARQKIWASACALAEDGGQRAKLQSVLEGCDRRINLHSGFLRKLNDVNTSAKFEKFCEENKDLIRRLDEDGGGPGLEAAAKASTADELRKITLEALATDSPGEEEGPEGGAARRSTKTPSPGEEALNAHGAAAGEPKQRTGAPSTATSPHHVVLEAAPGGDARQLKRKLQQTNGYSTMPREIEAAAATYGEKRNKTILEPISPATSPRGYAVGTKTVIVEPLMPRGATGELAAAVAMAGSPGLASPAKPRGYSSFLIEELVPTNAPSSPALRPTAYPLHSRDPMSARAPPNSPREALIAASVPAAWAPDQHHQQSYNATSITDLTANGHYHYHHQQQQQQHQQHQQQQPQHQQQHQGGDHQAHLPRDERRPLDLAVKGGKRIVGQEELHILEKEDKKKRRRVSDVGITWATVYAQQQQQQLQQQQQQQQQQQSQAYKARIPTTSASPREYPYLQHQRAQLYSYSVQEPALWNPAEMMPAGQRHPQRPYIEQQQQHHQQHQHQQHQHHNQHQHQQQFYRSIAHEKPVLEYKQMMPADYVLAVQRLHKNATTPEQVKPQDPATVQKSSPRGLHRVAPKGELPIKPVVILEPPSPQQQQQQRQQQQHQQQQQQQQIAKVPQPGTQEPRIMAEQFPTLGNWVAGLVKKQNADGSPLKKDVERITPTGDPRQSPYQPQNTTLYKTAGDIAVSSSSYVGSEAVPSITARWTTEQQQQYHHHLQQQQQQQQQQQHHHHQQQQQQQHQQQQQAAAARSYQTVPLQPGHPLPRHQNYYPSISTAPVTLSYPAKFPMDIYHQKSPVLNYSAPYPYPGNIGYPRMPSSSLEVAAAVAAASNGQQRVSPLIPLAPVPSSVLLDTLSADKQLSMQLQSPVQQRYYAAPEPGSPRGPTSQQPQPQPQQPPQPTAAYPMFGRRNSLVNHLEYATGIEHPTHYTRLLAERAAATSREMAYEQQRTVQKQQQQQQQHQQQQHQQQQQEIKVSTPELARSAGRQYKAPAGYVAQSSRNGIGGSPPSTSPLYPSPAGAPSHPLPRAAQPSQQQQQQHLQLSPLPPAVPAKPTPPAGYERECPTPSLGEVASRGPTDALRCSNCGAPGSRFECLGCETASYCNEACQTQHWSVHVTQCPKIMPRLKKVA